MDERLTDKINCAQSCPIPPNVALVRVPRPRHAWADVLVCPNCGDAFLKIPSPDTLTEDER